MSRPYHSGALGDEQAWNDLTKWVQRLDYRDISDEANLWADTEADAVAQPENIGEWKASMATAFEAGRQWERMLAARERRCA